MLIIGDNFLSQNNAQINFKDEILTLNNTILVNKVSYNNINEGNLLYYPKKVIYLNNFLISPYHIVYL